MIAHNPLHGSGQAGFPHPALALGNDAQATQGIGMTDRRQWQPAGDEAPHAIPKDAAFLKLWFHSSKLASLALSLGRVYTS